MNTENLHFFEAVKNCDLNKENLSFTVISGEAVGEKALFSDEKAIFFTHKNGFLSSKTTELNKIKETGIINISSSLVYAEKIGAAKKIIICGAGHVSIPIIRLAKTIGCHVTVIDDRKFFAENAEKAGADVVICDKFENALSEISGDLNTFFVIVTRGHLYDVECLRAILKKSRAYVGMMGSKRRVSLVREKLISEGYDENDVKKIHAPIGLAISAETPEEIAVSVIAEIIQIKNQNKTTEFSAEILDYILDAKNENQEKALCTIVSKKDAAPRNVGTKMLCANNGKNIGTIGGGLLEAKIIEQAEKMFSEKNQKTALMTFNLTAGGATTPSPTSLEEGEVCGGTVEIFVERL